MRSKLIARSKKRISCQYRAPIREVEAYAQLQMI